MAKIRVLIVDDSAFVRRVLSDLLSTGEIEVIGTARDGKEAIKKVRNQKPEVVILDIAMPGMNGLTVLEHIMAERPTPVLMLSAMSRHDAGLVIRSLELGATDFISKPSYPLKDMKDELISKVGMAALATVQRKTPSRPARMKKEVVAIGASAGGPAALAAVLPQLPEDLGAAVLIAQHMPYPFTSALAERLASKCKIEVMEARGGDKVKKGKAFIGVGGQHLTVDSGGRLKLLNTDRVHGVYPSTDVLMSSVAEVYGEKALGVVLTGMGRDGAAGVVSIKSRGGSAIAQDESTSLVYGMPKAAIETGCIDEVVPLPKIARAIVRYCENG